MRVRLGGPFLYREMAVESCWKRVSVAHVDNKKISKRELKRVKWKTKEVMVAQQKERNAKQKGNNTLQNIDNTQKKR